MTSLEVLILTAFALVIVFAALPYVVNTLYASMAPLEYRTASAYVLAFADSLEADFGMVGARKYFQLPNFVYGSFGAVNRTYIVELRCGQTYRLTWTSFRLWYNSTYLTGASRMLRGLKGGLVAEPGDALIAVNATERGVVAYPRLVLVRGQGESYLYITNATVVVPHSGFSYLSYDIQGISTQASYGACQSVVVDGVVYPVSGTLYVVVNKAQVVLR
ncbi:hypothetical protein Pogu_2355 [Pyrobaculum oguniense TE7]|uniref:Archaeal flagellin N-terminal-like domain protein n=1 Tax=Pyrobaculum oguniense (strain DSM 13380 / JCM 10595 / TE7) TaxID=698757 RepID=H6QBN1_PYROT|nr:hypothetical protein Pogu_2355 [Pyrobaculum oguniense TE7]